MTWRRIGLFLLLASLLLCASCVQTTTIEGRVGDTAGLPIGGATITLSDKSRKYGEVRTAPDGTYRISTTDAPLKSRLTLTIAEEGFKTYQQEFTPTGDDRFAIALKSVRQEGP